MRTVAIALAAWVTAPTIVAADTSAAATSAIEQSVEGAIVPGEHTRLNTSHGVVHVWAPDGYRADTASLVVYIHGYFVNADDAWWAHGLPEQFGAASLNALFVVPEAPSGPADEVAWSSLGELLAAVDGHIPEALPKRPAIAIGHSGAYRTLVQWQTDPLVTTIVMLDAGYGPWTPWLGWARRADRRLITVSSETTWWSDQLHGYLPSRVINGVPVRPEALSTSRVVHVRTTLDHWQVVTTALPATLRMLGIARL